jgi:hypothetical protein
LRRGLQESPISPVTPFLTASPDFPQKRMISGMSSDEQPKGKPVAIDHNAISASATEPAFVTPPKGAPVYHGFVVLDDVNVEGFTFGAITDFEAEPCDAGDAFVVAPDGSRAGLVWEVSTTKSFEQVLPFEPNRWGVWAVSFPQPMENRASARENLLAVLPDLKVRWEDWKQWRSRLELDQLS